MTHRSLAVSKTDRGAGTPAAGSQEQPMTPKTTDRQECTGDAPVRYTYHHEPPHEGGQRFARCDACGAELLCSLGGARKLVHKADCPAAVR